MIEKNKEFVQIIGVFAIRDLKHETFESPFLATSELNAKRRFILMIEEKNSVLNRWHKDYDLYQLNEFDTKTGYMNDDFVVKLILEGASYIKKGE